MVATSQKALALEWAPKGVTTPPVQSAPPASSALQRWVGQLCVAVAEVAAGDRSARQLTRVMAPATAELLQRRARLAPSRNAPVRRVLSVRISRPSQSTIEASAVVEGARRCQAVALQLRRRGRVWVVTAAEVR